MIGVWIGGYGPSATAPKPLPFSDVGGQLYLYNGSTFPFIPLASTTVTTFPQLGNLLIMYYNN